MELHELKDFISNYYGLDISDKCRRLEYIQARFMFYYIANYNYPKYIGLQSIGDELGYNHATVINGIKQAENFMQTDKDFKLRYLALLTLLKSDFDAMRKKQYCDIPDDQFKLDYLVKDITAHIKQLQRKRKKIIKEVKRMS